MRVVATAGHVDHGKSTLVQALTGVDPDRLPEEKARGLTIDLGFAVATLPSGEEMAFVDVPGHGRYVGNMLAGAGSVDACLFVVAATEGWKAQTEEHLRILQLFGLSHGAVALTKIGLAGEDRAGVVELEIRERLAGTFLAGAELVPVDVPAGIGVDELRHALDRLVKVTPPAPDPGRPRLWVDRSFPVRGSGTVVTGTLRGGCLEVGMEVVVGPGPEEGHASGRGGRGRFRIRALESHGRSLQRAGPGRRLAVNLAGLSHHDAGRGQALVRPGQWHETNCFDARLEVLSGLAHPVGRKGAYVVYTGSGEFPVRLRVLGAAGIDPGEEGCVRLWTRSGLGIPLLPGDRYVLREAGRFETVGGGEVLDVEPALPASRAAPSISVERVVRERGWVDADHLALITGQRLAPVVGRWVVDPDSLQAARRGLLERIGGAGREGLDVARLDDRDRALLPGLPGVSVAAGRARSEEAAPPGLSEAASRVLAGLEQARWSPPVLPVSDRAALRELAAAGLAVEAGELWFAATAVESAAAALSSLLAGRRDGFTVAEARDALGSSRRHVLPLLAHLDASGVTRRRGDRRIAGPRMAPATGRGVDAVAGPPDR